MRVLLQLLVSSLLISPLFSQSLTADQVKESLISLRNDIKTYNPALSDYNPNFEEGADQIISDLGRDSYSSIEHFRLITELCALSNEGHFSLGSWTDTPHIGFTKDIYEYMPISVQILDGKLYLWSDYSNENVLQRGDEILEINGTSAKDILEQLMRYTPSDGNIIGYAHRSISSGFNWMYYLYIDTPVSFDIKYMRLNGEVGTANISAITRTKLIENYKARAVPDIEEPESIKDVYELEINNTYAVLTLKSFTRSLLEKYGLKSTKFYQEVFEKINNTGASTLIIDLRNNNGGRKEYANDIIPYIMQIDSEDSFLRKSVSWRGKKNTTKLPKQSKNYYQGKVVTIVNAGTFSAASSLARFLKEYANATVVGQETGTRYEGFSAGSKQYVSVLHTDIQIGIPRYQTTYPSSKKQITSNRGLIPDHIITYFIEDVMNEKDLEMEFVINELIGK